MSTEQTGIDTLAFAVAIRVRISHTTRRVEQIGNPFKIALALYPSDHPSGEGKCIALQPQLPKSIPGPGHPSGNM